MRAALHAATGVSLSGWIRDAMKMMLGVLSPSVRYFVQPLLMLYYVSLGAERGICGGGEEGAREGRGGMAEGRGGHREKERRLARPRQQ